MSLTIQDFLRVVKIPKDFLVGFICQLVLLPIIAILIALLLKLPAELAIGADANCMCTWWCYIKCNY